MGLKREAYCTPHRVWILRYPQPKFATNITHTDKSYRHQSMAYDPGAQQCTLMAKRHVGKFRREGRNKWCRRTDSNREPTHYKCVALPVVLRRHISRGAIVGICPNQRNGICSIVFLSLALYFSADLLAFPLR